MSDKRYRECMTEIIGVLKKYDMAGAITVVDQNRCMNAKDIAYSVGPYIITVEDFARAIAVQDACGEEMNDPVARQLRMEAAVDILDRAFRFAYQRQRKLGASR